MPPKKHITIFASILACIGAGVLVWRGTVAPQKEAKADGAEIRRDERDIILALGNAAISRSIVQHGVRIRADLKSALDKRSFRAFSEAFNDLLYAYEGDPRDILRELEPYLDSRDVDISFLVAQLFLKCGFEEQRTTAVLLELMNRPQPVTGRLDDDTVPDLRLLVADLLAEYRVAGSADGIWSLYQTTDELKLLVALAGLRDQRAVKPTLARRGELSRVTELPPSTLL